jgi:hypothetical protein
MLAKKLMWILWPSFLSAGLIEMLVFALVDPQDLHWFGRNMDISREAIYTIAFFIFWMMVAAASTMTVFLAFTSVNINTDTSRDVSQTS